MRRASIMIDARVGVVMTVDNSIAIKGTWRMKSVKKIAEIIYRVQASVSAEIVAD